MYESIIHKEVGSSVRLWYYLCVKLLFLKVNIIHWVWKFGFLTYKKLSLKFQRNQTQVRFEIVLDSVQ